MAITRADQNQRNYGEAQWKSSLSQRRKEMGMEINTLEDDHRRKVELMTQSFEKQAEDLEKAYKVELSKARDSNAKELESEEKGHSAAMKSKKEKHEQEFTLVTERERQRIENYKKTQDEVLAKMKEKYLAAKEEMKANQV